MIHTSSVSSWRQIQKTNFTSWEKLAEFLQLDEVQRKEISPRPRFVLNLPFRLAQKIKKGTLEDPILRQFLPTLAENSLTEGFMVDPVGDCASKKSSKLLHKYQGRVLLVVTGACAMHCRYCFRQNFDYVVENKSFDEELAIIASDPSIKEVILSGGDPLSLSERHLEPLLLKICEISHVKRIRFHTRFPIGIPERIDQQFLEMVQKLTKQVWFVIHSNHPRELDEEVLGRLKELQKRGVVLLCQTVLLRGVNDQIETLQALCETLVDHGIFPYYLHQLDRVQGAAHFEVPKETGKKLIEELRKKIAGYGIPAYVQEVHGELSKIVIGNSTGNST